MSYTYDYTDDQGREHQVVLTDQDSSLALKNDLGRAQGLFNPDVVSIRRMQAAAGEALHLEVTVRAPSHYLSSAEDLHPKACDSMSCEIVCYGGYPLQGVKAFYRKNHYLASPNVFCSGSACIDDWIPFTSSLVTVIEKLVHDMIHDPEVTRYDSMANTSMEDWHRKGVSEGRFPTIAPRLLYRTQESARPALPPRRDRGAAAAPPLPQRRR